MNTIHPSPLLKRALLADAVASGACAALQLGAGAPLAALLGLPEPLLGETGWFLAAYALLLVVLARRERLWPALVGLVVIGNTGWALACLALPAAGLLAPTALGLAFLVGQAVAVLALAGLEWKGLQASRSEPAPRLAGAR